MKFKKGVKRADMSGAIDIFVLGTVGQVRFNLKCMKYMAEQFFQYVLWELEASGWR